MVARGAAPDNLVVANFGKARGKAAAEAVAQADVCAVCGDMAVVSRGKARLLASNLSDGPKPVSAKRTGPVKKRSAAKRKPNDRRSTR